jgi:alcohol dehydrogenase class IV
MERILGILNAANKRTVILFTGQNIKEVLFEPLTTSKQVIRIRAGEEKKFLAIPELIKARESIALVAIGGGRVIDAAKQWLYKQNMRPLFIAVPTTAGSGSEATPFAVVYEGGLKTSIEDEKLLPDVAILDKTYLHELDKKQKAISGLDAFAQAVESIWSLNANASSLPYSFAAIRMILKNFSSFLKNDDQAAKEMLWAAHLSGRAIAYTRTTGPHALSYYLTIHHGVPHGQAVAFFLPVFFLYNEEVMLRLQKDNWNALLNALGAEDAAGAFFKVRGLMAETSMAIRFSDLGIVVDADALLESVNVQRFSNNPASYERARLKQLIEQHIF